MDNGLVMRCSHCGRSNRVPATKVASRPLCGQCRRRLDDAPVDVDDATLQLLIRHCPVPVVVDFWAPWCAPCRSVAPHLERLALHNAGRLVVAKVNTDQHQGFASRLSVRAIPTLAVFKGGELQEARPGALMGYQLERFVAEHLED